MPIHLRINSPGGDVFDGLAIYNALIGRKSQLRITIDGIAASADSFIAMAGSRVEMPPQAMLMIHNAWGGCIGNRNDMIEVAAVLEKIDGMIAETYAAKSGGDKAALAAAMDAETWYKPAEAKAAGLCDAILGEDAQQAARVAARSLGHRIAALSRRPRAADQDLPDYDPDGDGDNDAEEALGHINTACAVLASAMDCLTGGGGASARLRAAATEAEWVCGADEKLPIDQSDTWDGPAAAERMLDAAVFNGNSPDPAKAKRGFLAWDHHNPNLKGSYKLPFADVVGGELKAVRGGIDAGASRLPQTDIPADVKQRARDVLDAYESRMRKAADLKQLAAARQRQAEAA